MQRALLALVVGAVAGIAATYVVLERTAAPGLGAGAAVIAPERGSASVPAERRSRQTPAAPADTAERAALYREVADADGAALARLIAQAAASPPSSARSYKLGVLLERYAELDAERAVEFARKIGMSADALAALYAQWAAGDPAGALAALGNVASPAAAIAIGRALLPVLGDDDYALRQVLAALPQGAENGMRIEAIADRAASDPATAFDRALALDDFGASRIALDRVGAVWGRTDPRAALESAETIDDIELRTTFQSEVLRAWAQLDSQGLLEHVIALDSGKQERLAVGLMEVARFDPERTLAIADRFPSSLRGAIQRAAVEALARTDPEGALERIRTLPLGPEQQFARQTLARVYGKRDPDAALAWARASADREAMLGVLSGIAVTDPSRAFDVAATLPTMDRGNAYLRIVGGAASDRDADFPALAERLLAAGDEPATANGMIQLVQMWQTRAPDRAAEWVVANGAHVPPGAFQVVGRYLAQNDPAGAERRLVQIPAEGRNAWLQGMAQGYAQSDAKAAVAWVDRLRNDPAYPAAASTIAQGLAGSDPQMGAALLDSVAERGGVSPQTITIASNNVAAAWARTNPLAAAEWARGFADKSQVQLLGAVVQTWAGSDAAAARAWTLQMPAGGARDAALRPLLTSAGNGVDTSLLPFFSGDAARQQAVVNAASQLARRDPAEARALVDRYVTRPELRTQADRILEAAGRGGPLVGPPF
jgi:hypothetical protein